MLGSVYAARSYAVTKAVESRGEEMKAVTPGTHVREVEIAGALGVVIACRAGEFPLPETAANLPRALVPAAAPDVAAGTPSRISKPRRRVSLRAAPSLP